MLNMALQMVANWEQIERALTSFLSTCVKSVTALRILITTQTCDIGHCLVVLPASLQRVCAVKHAWDLKEKPKNSSSGFPKNPVLKSLKSGEMSWIAKARYMLYSEQVVSSRLFLYSILIQ